MLRIAICDDETVFLELEKDIILKYLNQRGLNAKIYSFTDGESLLKDKTNIETYDLIVLDVEMEGMDGITVAEHIRAINDNVNIAFLSAYMDYSTDGYHVKAIRYILKEKDDLPAYLHECLDCVLENLDLRKRLITLGFTTGKETLRTNTIHYLESSGNYTTFYVINENNPVSYTIRCPISKITGMMTTFDFVSVNAKETVNLLYVKSVSRYKLVMKDGKEFQISQKKYNDVYRTYTLYRGKNI